MILLDLSYLVHRTIWSNKEAILQNTNFFPHLLTSQILQFSKKLGASKVNKFVICLDSPTWRKEYFETNKSQFPELKDQSYKGNRTKDDTIPWDDIYSAMDSICESLKQNSDFYVMKVNGAEADDIIAVLTNLFKDKEEVFIVSPDKDFIQLQSDKVKIYDPLKNAYKPEQDIETYLKIHIMIGDKVDNIPAIRPRLGEKTAIKILKDLDDLLTTDPVMKQKWIFNENLIDLSKVPVYISDAIRSEFEKQEFNFNSSGIMKTFMKYQMAKLSEDISTFKFSDVEMKTPTNQYFKTQQRNQELSRNNLEDFFS